MKRKKLVVLVVVLLVLFIIPLFSNYSFADFGDFEKDGGSVLDWSSQSSDYEWKSDEYKRDSTYSREDRERWNRDSNTSNTIGDVFHFLFMTNIGRFSLVALIVFSIIIVKRGKKTNEMYQNGYRPYEKSNNIEGNQNTNKLQELDPNFSEEKFLSWAKDLFIKLQYAWTDRNLEPIRPFVSTEFFEQYNTQIKRYIDTDRINVLDRIAVNYAAIYQFRQEGDRDILEVTIKSSMIDYIKNASTDEVLEGTTDENKINMYRLTFERKKRGIN